MATRIITGFQIVDEYTQAQEDSLAIASAGKPANSIVIFNTTIPAIRIWNGTAFANAISIAAHTHPQSEITNLVNDLAVKAGYAAGAGGSVIQLVNKSTLVILNKICGRITMNGAALAAAAEVSFVLTNSFIAATDVVAVNIQSVGTAGSYTIGVTAVAAGSCTITLGNVSTASLSQAVVLNFAVIKSSIT